MAAETLEERVQKLESAVQEVQERLEALAQDAPPQKRDWKRFVGIYADSPDFDEVERIGQEWRNADRPKEGEEGE